MIVLAWAVFAGVLAGVVAVCWAVVRYYTDKDETEQLPFWTAVIGLALPLMCLLLIPVDIYNVSSDASYDDIAARAELIKVVYYSLYGACLAFMFGFIPFAYFYYEEEDENVSIGKKILGGCKYTAFLLVIVVVLLVIGLVIFFTDKSSAPKPDNSANAQRWLDDIVINDKPSFAESSIAFAVSCLTVLGYLIWITYTAYGLSALPISVIRGRKHVGEETQNVHRTLDDAREKKRLINTKYAGGRGTAAMSRRDRNAYEKLDRQERILARHSSRLEKMNTGWRKIWTAFKPFMFVFGFVFILFSLFIVVSMGLTNVLKATQTSWCGSKCGYVLAYPVLINPLDRLLKAVSNFFPVDYIILLGVTAYIFFATLSGIVGLGVRFLWMNMYQLQYRATAPQGLLMTAAFLMLAILAMNMELTTLAPQYSTWGTQTWVNITGDENTTVPCSLQGPPKNSTVVNGCIMTEVGLFVNRIAIRTSFFGVVYFYATWAFLAMFLVGIVLALIKSKGSNIVRRDDDSESDEDW